MTRRSLEGIDVEKPEAKSVRDQIFDKARLGEPIKFAARETVDAGILRDILLGLPRSNRSQFAVVGLHLEGASIDGRVNLDDARRPDGGPLPAIEFRDCIFDGGLTGRNAGFARLTFIGCDFRGVSLDEVGQPAPTVDLSGASLHSDLEMRCIQPAGEADYLWVRASGARIDGQCRFFDATLRAPKASPNQIASQPPPAALDLANAEVRGDLWFVDGSSAQGSLRMRSVQITGDVWMSGARIFRPGGTALFFQGATVGGFMMLDSRPEQSDEFGRMRRFRCVGNLNLVGAEIGRDLQLSKSVVLGDAYCGDLHVKNDVLFGAYVQGHLNLPGCRIGGTLDLSELTLGVESEGLDLSEGRIGRTLKLIDAVETGAKRHILIAARRKKLRCLPDVDLIETLWDYEIAGGHREAVQIAFLDHADGPICLDCDAQTLEEAARRFRPDLSDCDAAEEYFRIYCSYGRDGGACPVIASGDDKERRPPSLQAIDAPSVLTLEEIGDGFFEIAIERQPGGYALTACVLEGDHISRRSFMVAAREGGIRVTTGKATKPGPAMTGMPRFEGAIVRHPEAGGPDSATSIRNRVWVMPPVLEAMEDPSGEQLDIIAGRLAPSVLSSVMLHGEVGLENLSCDMLEDNGGRYWGRHLTIQMNHFVYNRATWEPDPGAGGEGSPDPAPDDLRHKLMRAAAEWLPTRVARRLDWTDALRLGAHWTTWQIKRNWIYQQFDTSGYPSSARYPIRQNEYRPQPFEQAIRVARAEGRADLAVHFEIAKKNIEWRLFTRRQREWFALLGVAVGAAWILHSGAGWVAMLGALALALGVAFGPAGYRHLRARKRGPLFRKRLLLLGLAAALGWLRFSGVGWKALLTAMILGALFIYISDLCQLAMHYLFGHLRRPIRAVSTLVAAFLVGWMGVNAANARGKLVIDVKPVAALVGQDEQSMVVGSQRELAAKNVASNVPCRGSINEALYALDILIPLIDLREEEKCEVGTAVPVPGHPFERDGLLGTLEEFSGDPEGFWGVLKALYAIAGWFIVSLSILTFANATRSTAEPG